MSTTLATAIRDDALKLIRRHQTYASRLAEDLRRMTRRGQTPPAKTLLSPAHWSVDAGFDPYYVRPRADNIAYAITRALRRRHYFPRPAIEHEVPKSDGGTRIVNFFQIADNAVSRLVYDNLMVKNAVQLSSHCYAYRRDLSKHDAVSYMAADFRERTKLFIAEYDFRKYFDSISHEHLRRLLADRRFYITKREASIIDAFMEVGAAPSTTYPLGAIARDRGVPQGTSISLFLANLAGYPLDRRLERLGVGFARFADDTVIWSPDYSLLCDAVDALNEVAHEMNVDLNLSKSDGISILADKDERPEFRSKTAVPFVGYLVGRRHIFIRDNTIAKAQQRISAIVYHNLLEGPLTGIAKASRVSVPADRDYRVMISQLRRYLYGDLSERRLQKYLSRAAPVVQYKGFMSNFPLVSDDARLRALDGWLVHTIWTTLRKRAQLLSGLGIATAVPPYGLSPSALVTLEVPGPLALWDLRIPSFFRISRMLRKVSQQFGPNAVSHPQSGQYYIV